MRPKVIEFTFKLTLLNWTIDDLERYRLFPKESNSTPNFKKFLRLVKDGQFAAARAMLFEDRFLVYHFDYVIPN